MTTTQPLYDSESAAHGQQVITATVFIHHTFDGVAKVFLPRRAAHKKFLPGIYELPGGHIDFGEDIVAGLRREVREEFQKEIRVGDPFAAFTYTNNVKGSHSIEVVYFAQFEDGTDGVVLDPHSHDTYGWFAEAEAVRMCAQKRDPADPELAAVRRGFALLKGGALRF